ncbi:hypothetical protein V1478_000923 [Vespula squamosa]|uniref:Uncharacterized protein n=1 Tax=Vespula squamosa TaxID=30214 RepID=A0ABD2C6V7_VESSQ
MREGEWVATVSLGSVEGGARGGRVGVGLALVPVVAVKATKAEAALIVEAKTVASYSRPEIAATAAAAVAAAATTLVAGVVITGASLVERLLGVGGLGTLNAQEESHRCKKGPSSSSSSSVFSLLFLVLAFLPFHLPPLSPPTPLPPAPPPPPPPPLPPITPPRTSNVQRKKLHGEFRTPFEDEPTPTS